MQTDAFFFILEIGPLFHSNQIVFISFHSHFSQVVFFSTSGAVHADQLHSCWLCRFRKHTEAQQNNLLECCSCDRLENPCKSRGFRVSLVQSRVRYLFSLKICSAYTHCNCPVDSLSGTFLSQSCD